MTDSARTSGSPAEALPAWGRDDEQFRLVVESSPAGMVIVDARGRIVMVNAQVERWFGYDRQELLGQAIEVLVPERFRGRHPEDRERYMAHPAERPMGGAGVELFARRKDGSEFPVDISLHPIHTAEGAFVLANIVDATERRRAEAQERRREATERLAVLGQLAGGVAHEIRNPLGVIKNSLYYLRMLGDRLQADGLECLDDIDRELHTAERIVSELLDYARDPRQHAEQFVAQEAIDQALGKSEIPTSVQVDQIVEAPDAQVFADRDQIERVLLNLIRNAVQAMPSGGRLTIRSGLSEGAVLVEVIDTGIGLTTEEAARVFEPLYTKKAKGIGLGLAVSRRYAEQNGGRLDVTSAPAQGATFRLTLPLAAARDDGGDADERDSQ